ncbi:hypothetical protein Fmac_027780 [Flemingia macrophylla]|uniref:Uncharacterized protein n=1 Tax=Flemingia macrophylla TaxID=520843 RepID=A0ABD1LIU2_9FABA
MSNKCIIPIINLCNPSSYFLPLFCGEINEVQILDNSFIPSPVFTSPPINESELEMDHNRKTEHMQCKKRSYAAL